MNGHVVGVCLRAGGPLVGLYLKGGTKGEHVEPRRCAGQSLTSGRQQQRQQQAQRPQAAAGHGSGFHAREQPVRSDSGADKTNGAVGARFACGLQSSTVRNAAYKAFTTATLPHGHTSCQAFQNKVLWVAQAENVKGGTPEALLLT